MLKNKSNCFVIVLALTIHLFNTDIIATTSNGSYSLTAYNKNKHKNALKPLIQDSYIVNRQISQEELSEINNATGYSFKTAREMTVTLLTDHENLPTKIYMLEYNNEVIGFIGLMEMKYNETIVYEICFFGFIKEYTLSEEVFSNMLSLIKEKALQRNIRIISIDLQKNPLELTIMSFLKQFGFVFAQHQYQENGVTGIYTL